MYRKIVLPALVTGAAALPLLSPAQQINPENRLPNQLPQLGPLFASDDIIADYEKVQDIISLSTFRILRPIHRQMLIGRYEKYRGKGGDAPAMCFTEGYPPEAIAAFEKAVWGSVSDEKFQLSNRWTFTATDGSVSQGEPLTLTYSFIDDGISISGFNGEPTSNSDLDAMLINIFGTVEAGRTKIGEGIEQWNALCGITFVREMNDDGSSFGSTSGSVGVRGDVRIGGHSVDGSSGSNTLAYNFFPNNGDMIIDTDNQSFYSDSSNNFLRLRNTLTHENGHGIGIAHVCPVNQTKLMEPFISTQFDGPQLDDILAAQRNYGDNYEENDNAGEAHDLGTLGIPTVELEMASTDDDSDVDYYSFTVTETGTVDISLTPKISLSASGNSYLDGSQNGDGSCSAGSNFDPSSVSDLTLELIDTNGTSVLRTANVNPAGGDETISGGILDTPGTYYVRVSPDNTNNVQIYSFSLDFTPGSGFDTADLSITKTDSVSTINRGESLTYTIIATNNGPDDADGATVTDILPDELESVSWTASYSNGASGNLSGNGDIDETLISFPNGGSVTYTVSTSVALDAGRITLSNTATVATPVSVVESNGANNDATDDNTFIADGLGEPNEKEEFNAFSSLTSANQTSSNDTGTNFVAVGTPDDGGFLLDTVQSQNGRGLTFSGDESADMRNISEFTHSSDSHMLAFCFQFADDGGSGDFDITHVIQPMAQGGSGYLYAIFANSDDGASVIVPTTPGSVQLQFPISLAPDEWHTCVVQFTSASDSSTQDGAIEIWFNPSSASDSSNINIPSNAGLISSQFGNGPMGKYAFGTLVNIGVSGGPTVFVDSIGTWDGFGSPGLNDLQAALDFLDSKIPDCPEDINNDGEINAFDAMAIANNYGTCNGCDEDLNADGVVNVFDAIMVGMNFGICTGQKSQPTNSVTVTSPEGSGLNRKVLE